jgi:hypothetical protein
LGQVLFCHFLFSIPAFVPDNLKYPIEIDAHSGCLANNATKADEPKTKQDGAIIFCRGPKRGCLKVQQR